jgi:hypothetical protein
VVSDKTAGGIVEKSLSFHQLDDVGELLEFETQ